MFSKMENEIDNKLVVFSEKARKCCKYEWCI